MPLQTRTVLAVASWLVVAVALGVHGLDPAQSSRSIGVGKRQATRQIPTTDDRIGTLQKGIQNALDDLTMTNLREISSQDEKGRPTKVKVSPTFGFSRTPTFLLEHDGVLRDSRVSTFNMSVEFYGVSCSGKPIVPAKLALHEKFGGYASRAKQPTKEAVVAFAAKSVERLKSEMIVRDMVDGCVAQARALKITKPECLPCHRGMKVGDTAAIMVYLSRPVAN